MRKCAVIVGMLAFCTLATAAHASLYTWGATPDWTDPDETGILDSQDILSIWHAADATMNYMRFDLEAAPGDSYAGMYGIYIDADGNADTGAQGSNFSYVPSGLNGIDYIVDWHYDTAWEDPWFQSDFHAFVADPCYAAGGYFSIEAMDGNAAHDGGKLEWKFEKASIGNEEFVFYAASHDGGSSTTTYDYAPNLGSSGITVPEPSSMILIVAGASLLALRRRRRA